MCKQINCCPLTRDDAGVTLQKLIHKSKSLTKCFKCSIFHKHNFEIFSIIDVNPVSPSLSKSWDNHLLSIGAVEVQTNDFLAIRLTSRCKIQVDKIRVNNAFYVPCSIIVHSGLQSKGHFYALNKRNQDWIKYNDGAVSRRHIHSEDLIEDVYVVILRKSLNQFGSIINKAHNKSKSKKFAKLSGTATLKGLEKIDNNPEINAAFQIYNSLNLGRNRIDVVNKITKQLNSNNRVYYWNTSNLGRLLKSDFLFKLTNHSEKSENVDFLNNALDLPSGKPICIQYSNNSARISDSFELMGIQYNFNAVIRSNFGSKISWKFDNLKITKTELNEDESNFVLKIFVDRNFKSCWNVKPPSLFRVRKPVKKKPRYRSHFGQISTTPWLKGFWAENTCQQKIAAVLQFLTVLQCKHTNPLIRRTQDIMSKEGVATLRGALQIYKTFDFPPNVSVENIFTRLLDSEPFGDLKKYFLFKKSTSLKDHALLGFNVEQISSGIILCQENLDKTNFTSTSDFVIVLTEGSQALDTIVIPSAEKRVVFKRYFQISKNNGNFVAERNGFHFQDLKVQKKEWSTHPELVIYCKNNPLPEIKHKLFVANADLNRDLVVFLTKNGLSSTSLCNTINKHCSLDFGDYIFRESAGVFSANVPFLNLVDAQSLRILNDVAGIYRVILPVRMKPLNPLDFSIRDSLLLHIKNAARERGLIILEKEQFRLENSSETKLKAILNALLQDEHPPVQANSSKHVSICSANVCNVGKGCKLDQILEMNPSIVCLQEIVQNSIPPLQNYSVITHNRKCRGTAILVKNELKTKVTKCQHPSDSSCAIGLKIKSKKVQILNAYLPVASNAANLKQHREDLRCLGNFSKSNLILTGDLNGWIESHNLHMPWDNTWRKKPAAKHGSQLEDFILGHKLHLVEKENPKLNTRAAKGNQTTLDYFICNNVRTSKMKIGVPIIGSDHRPIFIDLLNLKKPRIRTPPVTIRKVHKLATDDKIRHAYRDKLKSKLPKFQKISNPKIIGKELDDLILNSFDDIVGKNVVYPSRNKMWWDAEYHKAKLSLQKLEETSKKSNGAWISEIKKIEFLNEQKKLAKLRKSKKKRRWHKLMKDVNKSHLANNKKWRNLLKDEIQASNVKIKCVNGKTSDVEIRKEFANHYESLGKQDNIKIERSAPIFSTSDTKIKKSEIQNAVKKLINRKAAPDEIRNEMIKYGKEVMIDILFHTFNVLRDNNTTPDEWSQGLISSLFKKGPKDCPGNYRPITLLPALRKIYAMILNIRLTNLLEKQGTLDPTIELGDPSDKETDPSFFDTSQNGFRTTDNRNCEDHIYTLAAIQKFAVQHRKKIHLCFIDFKAAFDSVPRHALMYCLSQLGLEQKDFNAIVSLYQTSKDADQSHTTTAQALANGGKSRLFEIKRGVAQGCPLSPTLFGIYINSLLRSLNSSGLGIDIDSYKLSALAYADDIILLADSHANLQKLVNIISDWSKKWGMSPNIAKCGHMIFALEKHESMNTMPNIFWNDIPIPRVSKYKYLGVIFELHDNFKLKWKSHLNMIIGAACSRLKKFSKLFNDTTLNTSLKLKIYEENIRSQMEYGGFMSWCEESSNSDTNKLESIQCKCLKMITNIEGSRDIWQPGLEYELGIASLKFRRNRMLLHFWHKIVNMQGYRIPRIVFERRWRKKANTNLRNTIKRLARRRNWNIDAEPLRFGFSHTDSINRDNISKYWSSSPSGLSNFAKSKICWRKWILERMLLQRELKIRKTAHRIFKMHAQKASGFRCKNYLFNCSGPNSARLRLLVENGEDSEIVCPLCRESLRQDMIHFAFECPALAPERSCAQRKLHKQSHNLMINTCINPENFTIMRITDEFLSAIQQLSTQVISTTNLDCISYPDAVVNNVFDVMLQGHTLRAEILSYNPETNTHTFAPGKWDRWPDHLDLPTVAILKNFGEGDSFNLIPEPFQLSFNPITHPSNLGKRYFNKAHKRFILVRNLNILKQDLTSGNIGCQHNRTIASRYTSGPLRESNAARQGVT